MIDRLISDRVFSVDKVGNVGTTETFYDLIQARENEILIVNRVCCYNSHASQTLNFAIGVLNVQTFERLSGKKWIAALDYYVDNQPMLVTSPGQLRIGVLGSDSGTTFEVRVQGYIARFLVSESESKK